MLRIINAPRMRFSAASESVGTDKVEAAAMAARVWRRVNFAVKGMADSSSDGLGQEL